LSIRCTVQPEAKKWTTNIELFWFHPKLYYKKQNSPKSLKLRAAFHITQSYILFDDLYLSYKYHLHHPLFLLIHNVFHY